MSKKYRTMIKVYSRKIKLLVLFNFLVVNLNFVYSQCATFDQIGPLCTGTVAPALPLVSNEGIAGTWSPSVIDMSTPGTQTYVFTSSDPLCTDFITMDITVNQTPNVLINGLSSLTTSVCVSSTLTLNASSTDIPGPNSYLWQQGAATPTAGPVVNYTPGSVPTPNPTTFTLYGSETGNTCVGQATATITVNALPTATITAGGPLTFCAGGSVLLTANAGVGLTYQWQVGGVNIPSATSQTFTATTAGSYTVVVTNATGCSRTSLTRVVTVNPLPTASISYAGSPFCGSGTVAVTSTGTAGGTYTASPAGLSITAATGSINLSTSIVGTYTVTYTFSSGGCSNTATTLITINPPPAATISYTGSPFCATGTKTVTQTGTTGGTYSSTAGLTIDGTTGTIDLATSTPGTYTITYTIPASGSCSLFTTTASVTINPLPTATISYAGSPFCATGSATVTSTGTAGGTYSASPAGLSITAGTGAINLATSTPGTYTVTYTFTSGGCTNTATTSVTVNALPTATISYSGSPFCATGTANVVQTGTAGGSYSSTVGLSITAGTGAINLATSTAGTYTITYTFTSGGCTNTATTSVTINALPTATISYPGSPFCPTGTALVTRTGTAGGSYASTAGLTINSGTGAINLATSTPGTYTVTYSFTSAGCSNTATTTVTISPLPTATISYVGSPFCAIGTAAVTQTGTAGGTYTSTAGLSITAGTGLINLATSTAGTYTVTYSFGSAGCTNTATTSVTINSAPTATISYTGSPFCPQGTATVTQTGTTGGVYSSTAGLVINSATGAVDLAASTSGSYTITYTIAATGSCPLFTTTFDITINNSLPVATISYTGSPFCATGTSSVTQTGVAGGTYSSTAGLSLNAATGDINLATSTPGTYTITYTFTSGSCTNTTTTSITINASPLATITASSPLTFCNGNSVTLTANSGAGLTYQWQDGGVDIPGETTSAYIATTSGFYTVNVTNLNGCTASSSATVVTVNASVTPDFSPIAPICSGGTFTLPATSNDGILGSWSPAFNNTATTTYTFTPLSAGCATTVQMTVTINPIVTPTFTAVAPICVGATLSALPTTSNNLISGTWSPALNNTATTTYTFTPSVGQCGSTTTMTITVNPILTPTFTAVAPICSGATLSPLPTTSNNGIIGTWSPALNNTATTTYTFTPNAGQCGSTITMTITVNPIVTPTFDPIAPVCFGTSVILPTTSNNGITGTWAPTFNSSSSTAYTFTPTAGQCASTAFIGVSIIPNVTSTFTQVAPICSGGTFTLPATSNEGITGTWAPAINTTTTTTYTFTPDAGQCGTTATMTVFVNTPVTPTFSPVAAICSGGTLSPLPTIDLNGITGTWSPVLNNTTTTTYTFTPTAGLCATTATLSISVNPNVTPSFTPVAAICSGATLSPLPTIDLNGITGSWSPALNNTSTTIYTFTPSSGQCASNATMTITVNPPVTPLFTAVAPICAGEAFSLPAVSTNGIFGSWSPAFDNTTTTTYTFTGLLPGCTTPTTMTVVVNPIVTPSFTAVGPICSGATLSPLPTTDLNGITGVWSPALNNTTTTSYTFSPTTGQCATTGAMTIVVNPNVTPLFASIAPICSGATLSPLPTTSTNGITGTWSPALNNTATTTYTFTPDAGQCATSTTLTITVNPNITPTFTPIGSICFGATLTLPTVDLTGITGTWSPAPNNTSSSAYLFTPDAGQCATVAFMAVTVTPNVIPFFNAIAPICSGATLTLPTSSVNGITGTWSPAPNTTATTTYTFTPSTGQCATTATITVSVLPNAIPLFAPVAPICAGGALSALPTTDINGITGSWSPALNNATTTTYTFTPTPGICATSPTLTITVNPIVTPTFGFSTSICTGDLSPVLPATSVELITGIWSPTTVSNTTSGTYTFTPTAGQCSVVTPVTITVNPIVTPTFTAVPPLCAGSTFSLPTTSVNGITGSWSPVFNNTATTTYTFTPDLGQCAVSTTLTITITPNVTPTFTAVGPFCSGATISALQVPSNEGITGVWTPAINNTATTTYTFTPSAGVCALTQSMTIVITPNATPTFTTVSSYCSGATMTPLQTPSNEGITGVWSPALNNTATTTYTFTPTTGVCALNTTTVITINPIVTPTFGVIAPVCQGASYSLPTVSVEGITGSWSPAFNNTATTTYTFTPAANQCAVATTLTVTITPNATPVFTAVGPFCSGATISALPTTDNNGITGSWSPALNNTSTTTYTFTPSAGVCAFTQSMTVVITPNATPVFTAVSPICSGGTLSPLPTTDNNGITGSWTPALNNTATTTYTFTPTTGICALNQTMTITVNPIVTPTFAVVSPYCVGATMNPLPTTSTNGITGVWSPALDNTVTTTYTFTPTAGQCATTTTMTVVINQLTVPTFAAIAPACEGTTLTALPTVSLESIAGSWSPVLDNMNTTTYTFTPTAGQCADLTTLTITINPPTVPTFTQVGPICVGNTYTLLSASLEAITGAWSPAIDNTQTTTYTFTPDAGQCSSTTTMTVAVVSASDADFTVSNYCDGIGSAPVVTGLAGGVFSFNPPVSDGATIDPISGLISDGVINTTYVIQYTLTGSCTVFSQELVSFVITPTIPIASSDTTYCLTSTFLSMTATNGGGMTIWYTDPEMTNILGTGTNQLPLSTLGTTSYYVSENLQGCYSPMDTVIVTVNDCYEFTATSAFTPDGDGINDTWVIAELSTRYPNNNVTIFNRWGQVLYNSDGYLTPWDGKFNNKDLPVGSYYYIIDFNDALDTPNATGIVTIIRN